MLSTRRLSNHRQALGSGLIALFLLAVATPVAADNAPAPSPAVQVLRELLAAGAPPVPDIDAAIGGDALSALKQVYAARADAAIWLDASGLAPSGKDLVTRLAAIAPVLPPALKPLAEDLQARQSATDPHALAELDLVLSALYGAMAVKPDDPEAAAGPGAVATLAAATDPALLLHLSLPRDPGFWRLRAGLVAYRAVAAAGGWGTVADGDKLQRGDSGARVDALRRRLAVTGDLAAPGGGAFDPALEQAVRHFQARHGLEADGVVGAATLAALNRPVVQRLETLTLNLLRLQQQDRNWGPRYIAVNIAAAGYRLVVSGRIVFDRPAVVGKPSWPSPTLDSVIDRVEFHPYWRIPMAIADQELWPKQDADPNYFTAQGIHIVDDQLVQDPGPGNPLGAVKFLFDNPYSVYLHDTTAPDLFAQAYRFSSHGCIRVAEAGDLAAQLLGADPDWSQQRVATALKDGGNRTIRLLEPIPLHIVYDTAWVDEDGTVEFRDDVYGRDRNLRNSGATPANATIASADAKQPSSTCDD